MPLLLLEINDLSNMFQITFVRACDRNHNLHIRLYKVHQTLLPCFNFNNACAIIPKLPMHF